MKIRNPLIKRILILLFITVFVVVILFFAIKIILDSTGNLAYDLGETINVNYQDKIIKNFNEYQDLVQTYQIAEDLTENDFKQNYYLASFQDYDKCAEKKMKTVTVAQNADSIDITYKIYNKCGLCKKHTALHLIKIDPVSEEIRINYNYEYENELNCGTIK